MSIVTVEQTKSALERLTSEKRKLRQPTVKIRPNLLRNATFGSRDSIVNQRAIYSYTDTTCYTVDGWEKYGGGKVIHKEGLELNGDITQFRQWFPKKDCALFTGKTVTISVVYSPSKVASSLSIGLNFKTFVRNSNGHTLQPSKNQLITHTFEVGDIPDSSMDANFYFYFKQNGYTGMLRGCKVEFGDTQTLAYLDDNEEWQLYEPIQNYEEELKKCQKWLRPIPTAFNGFFGSGTTAFSDITWVQSMEKADVNVVGNESGFLEKTMVYCNGSESANFSDGSIRVLNKNISLRDGTDSSFAKRPCGFLVDETAPKVFVSSEIIGR